MLFRSAQGCARDALTPRLPSGDPPESLADQLILLPPTAFERLEVWNGRGGTPPVQTLAPASFYPPTRRLVTPSTPRLPHPHLLLPRLLIEHRTSVPRLHPVIRLLLLLLHPVKTKARLHLPSQAPTSPWRPRHQSCPSASSCSMHRKLATPWMLPNV